MRTDARHVPLSVIVLPVLLLPIVPPAEAQSATEPTAAELAEQSRVLKREYEARIGALEARLSVLESGARDADAESTSAVSTLRPAPDNAFNPAIGIVLNGMFSEYSAGESEIPEFPIGHSQKRKRRTVAKWSTRRWPRDSVETVSGIPGAIQ